MLLALNVRGACSLVLEINDPAFAGNYNLIEGDSNSYRAGRHWWALQYESRNWFAFSLPTFPAPLIGAELRVYAGVVWTNMTFTYELHQVTTPVDVVVNHGGDRTATFNDLGDGPVLGDRTISSDDGLWYGTSALLNIPLNAAGLAELSAKQGTNVCLGGVISTGDPFDGGWAFEGAPRYPIQLVLYFSNAGPPEVSAISYDPSLTRLADERVNLAAIVCGQEPLRRQWTRNGVPVPNATNGVLEIRNLTVADGGTYRLTGSNDVGTASSQPVLLNVLPAEIWEHPDSGSVSEGQYITLSVSAESRLPLHYQWRWNGVNLNAPDQRYFSIAPAHLTDSGGYDVVIYNTAGAVTSQVAQVTVNPAPPIFYSAGVTNYQNVAVGLPLTITYYLYGGSPTGYQWYRNNQPIPGATSHPLQITSVGFNDAGAYRLVAANGGGSATSDVTRVSVQPLVITNVESWGIHWLNPFTLLPMVQSTLPVSLQWYFKGAKLPGATNQAIRFSAFDYTNVGSYFLVGSNAYGVVTSIVAQLNVVTGAPSVYAYPTYRRVWVGDDVTFTASVLGGPPPQLRWLFNGVPIPGQTKSSLTLKDVSTNARGQYILEARNTSGVTPSDPMVLDVLTEAPFFVRLPSTSKVTAGTIFTLRAQAFGGPTPIYQWRKDGADLPGETNRSLAFGAVQPGDAGIYELVARNVLGEARSRIPLTVSPATGLDRWQWRLPKAQGSRLYNVIHRNGRYVAVGKSGNLISSVDGRNWTSVTVDSDTDMQLVTWGNGVYVASGWGPDPLIITNWHKLDGYTPILSESAGLVLVSSNALDWLPVKGPDNDSFGSLTFGNGRFVASGLNMGAVHTSSDGVNWQTHSFPGTSIYHIRFGNGVFVASVNGKISYSVDGMNWIPSGPRGGYDVMFTGGRFYVWESLNIYESNDGISWTRIGRAVDIGPMPDTTFVFGAGRFVGIDSEMTVVGQVLTSTDAVNWVPVDTGTRQEIERVIYANGEFLAVGEAGMVSRSSDGLSWTPNEIANKVDFYGITHGEGLHAIAGDAGTIMTSSNGTDWVRRTTPTTRNLHAVAYGGGWFAAGGRGGALIVSGDGISWTARNSGIESYIERIAYAGGRWVGVAEQGGLTTSGDGVNWRGSSTGPPLTDHEGVAYGNGIWVVVGGYFLDPERESRAVGTIYISTDTSTWTRREANWGKRWRGVAFGRGKFVVVGNDGLMAVSTNGLIWAGMRYIANLNLRSVYYANGRFVAVGNDGTLISSADPANGLPWTKHRSHSSQNLHDIHATDDGTFIYVGNNGMVLQSGDTRPRFLTIDRTGRLEFDRGIADSLRLERSTDLRTWETEAANVTSPHNSIIEGPRKFWRLAVE